MCTILIMGMYDIKKGNKKCLQNFGWKVSRYKGTWHKLFQMYINIGSYIICENVDRRRGYRMCRLYSERI